MISDSGAVRVPFLSSKNVFTGHAPASIISPSAMGTLMMISPLESALGDDRASDGHVREPERGEPFQIGESQAAADDAGDDG